MALRLPMKPFPVNRSVFPDPKAGASPLPLSKILGSPNRTLIASQTFPPASVVNPLKPFPLRPEGAFERSLASVKVLSPAQPAVRAELRRVMEQKDRIIRLRAGKTLGLKMDGPTGWDWIKYGRRVNFASAGNVTGLMAPVQPNAVRGTQGDATRVPAGKLQTLAAKGAASDALVPAPLMTMAASPAPLAAADPDSRVSIQTANPNLYLIVALLVVFGMLFVMVKGKR